MFRFVFIFMFNLFLILQISLRVDGYSHYYHNGVEDADEFSNEWIVRVRGGEQVAQLLALETGYTYVEKLPEFADTYIFTKDDHIIQRRAHHRLTKTLYQNPKVQWAEQLFIKKRQKRDFLTKIEPTSSSNHSNNERIKRDDMKMYKVESFMFNDELWSQEWYMHDSRTRDDLPKLDLNVIPVYQMGITGKGVKVSILDDGIEYTHDDLKDNYDPSISYDCNEKDHDPSPRYDSTHRNAHGTRCAGEVAMTANNEKCGVGVAYGASIGGIKLLDGIVNDRVEGAALGFGYDKIDVYSASWGPNDDGKTVEGPGRLAQEALERGVTLVFRNPVHLSYLSSCSVLSVSELMFYSNLALEERGRNGLGIIYVFASGNGGSRGDNCNCDGYIGSIYTVAIGSASQKGSFPWYGEPCAATMAVTYSSGAYRDQMITTTDLHNTCTIKHTGTSASAPLAAGIIALGLEANRNLTWRDVQHLIAWTSEYKPLEDNKGWNRNGAGYMFDVRFGFGLMNAHSLVKAAQTWINVPEKSICYIKSNTRTNASLLYNTIYTGVFNSDGCTGTENEVNFLEHVEVKVNILYSLRGALEIFLTSPRGTRLPLLNQRKLDRSSKGFINWKFMSVGTWGEDPEGKWFIEIIDRVGPLGNHGQVGTLTLALHGTKQVPNHLNNGPRKYNTNYEKIDMENIPFIAEDIENPRPLQNLKEDKLLKGFMDNLVQGDENYALPSEAVNNIHIQDVDEIKLEEPSNYIQFQPSINPEFVEEIIDEDKILNRVYHQNSRLHNDYYFLKPVK